VIFSDLFNYSVPFIHREVKLKHNNGPPTVESSFRMEEHTGVVVEAVPPRWDGFQIDSTSGGSAVEGISRFPIPKAGGGLPRSIGRVWEKVFGEGKWASGPKQAQTRALHFFLKPEYRPDTFRRPKHGLDIFYKPKRGPDIFQGPSAGLTFFPSPNGGPDIFHRSERGPDIFPSPNGGLIFFTGPNGGLVFFEALNAGLIFFFKPERGLDIFRRPKRGLEIFSQA